jgi:hypothetical protein
MKNKSLEERIQRLESIEAIKNLTARYAFHVNQGWNNQVVDANAMSEIFTQDATWESADMNIKVTGLPEIIQSLKDQTEGFHFAMHSYSNPIIDVDETVATANWLFWIVSKPSVDLTNQVYMSTDITYIQTSDGWRIKAVQLFFGNMLSTKQTL